MRTMMKQLILFVLLFSGLSLPIQAESLAGVWENQLGERLELDSSGQILRDGGANRFDLYDLVGQLANLSASKTAKSLIVAEAGQAFSSDILGNQPDGSDLSQRRLLYGQPRGGEEMRRLVYYKIPVSASSLVEGQTVVEEVFGAASAGEVLPEAEEASEPVEEIMPEEELVSDDQAMTVDESEPAEIVEDELIHDEQLEDNFAASWEENYTQDEAPRQQTSYRRSTGQSRGGTTRSSRTERVAPSASASSTRAGTSFTSDSSSRERGSRRASSAEKLPDAGDQSEKFLSLLGLFSLSVASYPILRRRKNT